MSLFNTSLNLRNLWWLKDFLKVIRSDSKKYIQDIIHLNIHWNIYLKKYIKNAHEICTIVQVMFFLFHKCHFFVDFKVYFFFSFLWTCDVTLLDNLTYHKCKYIALLNTLVNDGNTIKSFLLLMLHNLEYSRILNNN